jgi:hypothetical protein
METYFGTDIESGMTVEIDGMAWLVTDTAYNRETDTLDVRTIGGPVFPLDPGAEYLASV